MKKALLWGMCLFLVGTIDAQTTKFDYRENLKKHRSTIDFRNGEIYIVDSVHCFQYNETIQDVVPQLREYSLATNQDGEVTTRLIEFWNVETNTFRDRHQVLRAFDNQGKLSEEILQLANNGSSTFENSTRTRYNRNVAGNPSQIIHEVWNNGNWESKTRELYEYQSSIKPTLFIFQEYENGNWVNSFRVFTNYNQQGKIASSLFQLWQSEGWVNGNRTFETYNNQGQQTLSIREGWNADLNDWVQSSRIVYEYQFGRNNEVRTELFQDFDESWIPQSRELKFYDDQGNNSQTTAQNYLNEEWINVFNTILVYDAEQNLSRSVGELWVNNAWRTQNSCDYFYTLFTTDVQDIFAAHLACNFPNPFPIGNTFHCTGLEQLGVTQLNIYSMEGKLVYRQDVTNNTDFQINPSLPMGLYQVVMHNEKGLVFSKKIVFK